MPRKKPDGNVTLSFNMTAADMRRTQEQLGLKDKQAVAAYAANLLRLATATQEDRLSLLVSPVVRVGDTDTHIVHAPVLRLVQPSPSNDGTLHLNRLQKELPPALSRSVKKGPG